MNLTRFALFLAGLFLWGHVSAQLEAPAFKRFNTDNGLSHDEIHSIAKDAEGFLWVGTSNGLNRFDGRQFKTFKNIPGQTNTLPDNYIWGLSLDALGRLWVATPFGLSRWSPATQSFYLFETPEQCDNIEGNEAVSQLSSAPDGYCWVVTDNYLIKIDPHQLTSNSFPLPAAAARGTGRVTVDKKGRIWIITAGELYKFDPRQMSYKFYMGRRQADMRLHRPVMDIYDDDQGRVWATTWGNGLYVYEESRDFFTDLPDPGVVAIRMLKDTTANNKPFFWITGGAEGLLLYNLSDNTYKGLAPDPLEPYSHNGFMAWVLFKDYDTGIVWIGTENGLECYDPHSFRFKRTLLPLPKEFNQFSLVESVLPDNTDSTGNRYWVLVWGRGLFVWSRQDNAIHEVLPDGEYGRELGFDLAQGKDGTLWIAVAGGFDQYEPSKKQWKHFRGFLHRPMIKHNVLAVHIDKKGRLWIGSNNEGLFWYEKGMVAPERFAIEDSTKALHITHIDEDDNGRLWVSSFNGVFRVDPTTKKVIRIVGGGLPENYISEGNMAGRKGRVWLATRSGLVCTDTSGAVLKIYTIRDGLRINHVYKVVEDHQGKVWMITPDRLHRLDPDTGQINSYDKSEGLFSNIPTDGLDIMPNGEIFIGFQNAFNFFNPASMPIDSVPPLVTLTATRVLNKERLAAPGSTLTLHPNEDIISLEWAALNFSQAEKNRYAYRLAGFDKTWIETDEPLATYTNLDGGRYAFQVRAANSDGIWGPPTTILILRVIPPFRETWYYKALWSLAILLAASAVLFYRRRQREKLEEIRVRIARDLHDDMGSTLSSIRFFSEYAQSQITDQKPEVIPVLQRISSSAAILSEAMQDIIWTIHTRNDRLEDLVTRMREFGFRTLEARQISFHLQITDTFLTTRLSIAQRRNIYLIFKEAINNAVKYSGCNEVRLFLTLKGNRLRMAIEDNGKGFDLATVQNGHGLINMQRRAEEMTGDLQIKTQPGAGTQLVLTVKMK